MNHLSEKQILLWMSGERDEKTAAHIVSCSICRAEVSKFEETLRAFGRSATEWSEQQVGQRPVTEWAIRDRWRSTVRWVLVGAAASMLLAISLPQLSDSPTAPIESGDAALLETVSAQLEQPIASPMEPLADLVDWEAGAGTIEPSR